MLEIGGDDGRNERRTGGGEGGEDVRRRRAEVTVVVAVAQALVDRHTCKLLYFIGATYTRPRLPGYQVLVSKQSSCGKYPHHFTNNLQHDLDYHLEEHKPAFLHAATYANRKVVPRLDRIPSHTVASTTSRARTTKIKVEGKILVNG